MKANTMPHWRVVLRTALDRIAGIPRTIGALLTIVAGIIGLVWLLCLNQLPGWQAAVVLCWLAWAGLVAALHHRPPRRRLGG